MGGRTPRLAAALAFTILLSMIANLSVAVAAQPLPNVPPHVKYTYDEENMTIRVATPFYAALIDLKRGGGITEITVFFNSTKFNLLSGSGKYLPAIFPYVYSNTSSLGPGDAVIEVSHDNKTYQVSYPGYLATRPWRLVDIVSTASFVKVVLAPSGDASVDIVPLNASIIYIFYSYKPVIEYIISFENYAGEPVELYSFTANGTKYGVILEVVAGDDKPHLWNYTYTYVGLDGNATVISTNDPQVTVNVDCSNAFVGPYFSLIRLEGLANDTKAGAPLYALVAESLKPCPQSLWMLRGYVGEIKNTIRLRLMYPHTVLEPGAAVAYSLRLYIAPFDPNAIAAAGLVDYYYSLVGEEANITAIYNASLIIRNLENTVDTLQDTIDELTRQNKDLRDKLAKAQSDADGYRELYDTCKVELSIVKDRLSDCTSRVGRTAALSLVGLLVGLVVGVAGYALVFEKMGVRPLEIVKGLKGRRR